MRRDSVAWWVTFGVVAAVAIVMARSGVSSLWIVLAVVALLGVAWLLPSGRRGWREVPEPPTRGTSAAYAGGSAFLLAAAAYADQAPTWARWVVGTIGVFGFGISVWLALRLPSNRGKKGGQAV